MCIAIPGKIVEIDQENNAKLDHNGLISAASLELLPNAKIGDYVLVHAGFAIEIVSKKDAQDTINLIKDMQAC